MIYDDIGNDLFLTWTKFRVRYTFENNPTPKFKEEIWINDEKKTSLTQTSMTNTILGDIFTLVIGDNNISTAPALCKR
jgi:hypothetical protein